MAAQTLPGGLGLDIQATNGILHAVDGVLLDAAGWARLQAGLYGGWP